MVSGSALILPPHPAHLLPPATAQAAAIESNETFANVETATRFLSALFDEQDFVLFRSVETWTEAGKKRSRVNYRHSAVAEMRAEIAAETSRIAAIRKICAGRLPEIEAKAISEGWDANPSLEAGYSTIDTGGILSSVANKFLLDGFFSVERTWRNITAVRNVSDFKTVTSYRLIGKDQYERVAPGGELKHGSLGEEKYENRADTYGLLLSVDRRDIINDDLDAITTVPRKLGRGSGLKINDVFWGAFLANSGFFTSGNKNYLTGADTALSIDGLTKSEVAFMDQTDSDGKPIGVMPAILLVPTGLSALGTQLFKSLELRDTTSSTKYPVANPHQGKYRVEVSRYLSNSQYTGNSGKAWYLLSDSTDLPFSEMTARQLVKLAIRRAGRGLSEYRLREPRRAR